MYLVSRCGKVYGPGKSLKNGAKPRYTLKRIHKETSGYRSVKISPMKRYELIHRIVLRTFVGEPEPGMQGAHLDGDRTNNRIENLAWVTPKENAAHKILHGTHRTGMLKPTSKLTESNLVQILSMLDAGLNYSEIARKFSVDESQVRRIAKGEAWKNVVAKLRNSLCQRTETTNTK